MSSFTFPFPNTSIVHFSNKGVLSYAHSVFHREDASLAARFSKRKLHSGPSPVHGLGKLIFPTGLTATVSATSTPAPQYFDVLLKLFSAANPKRACLGMANSSNRDDDGDGGTSEDEDDAGYASDEHTDDDDDGEGGKDKPVTPHELAELAALLASCDDDFAQEYYNAAPLHHDPGFQSRLAKAVRENEAKRARSVLSLPPAKVPFLPSPPGSPQTPYQTAAGTKVHIGLPTLGWVRVEDVNVTQATIEMMRKNVQLARYLRFVKHERGISALNKKGIEKAQKGLFFRPPLIHRDSGYGAGPNDDEGEDKGLPVPEPNTPVWISYVLPGEIVRRVRELIAAPLPLPPSNTPDSDFNQKVESLLTEIQYLRFATRLAITALHAHIHPSTVLNVRNRILPKSKADGRPELLVHGPDVAMAIYLPILEQRRAEIRREQMAQEEGREIPVQEADVEEGIVLERRLRKGIERVVTREWMVAAEGMCAWLEGEVTRLWEMSGKE